MQRRAGTTRSRLAGLLLLAGAGSLPLAVVAGCSDSGDAADPASDAAFGQADQRYIVRGRVTQLPSDGIPPADLRVHHEPIPEFAGSDGTTFVNSDGVPGMKSMVMPFPMIEPSVTLDTVGIGDVINLTFEVKWTGAVPSYRVTAIDMLDADIELDFANPPAIEPAVDPGGETGGETGGEMADKPSTP